MSGKKGKMKTFVIVICLLLVLAGIGAILWMAWTMPVEEAQAYVERIKTFAVERVAPVAVAVLGAVAVILGLIAPAMAKVKTSAESFSAGVEAMKKEQTSSEAARASVEAYKTEQAAALDTAVAGMDAKLEARLRAMEEKINAACSRITGVSDKVDTLVERQQASMEVQMIAAENRPDLVRSGHAARIEEIAGKYRGGGHE